jgi:hypothetical protein
VHEPARRERVGRARSSDFMRRWGKDAHWRLERAFRAAGRPTMVQVYMRAGAVLATVVGGLGALAVAGL